MPKMKRSNRIHERNEIGFAGIAHGPEASLEGKMRHRTVLSQLFLRRELAFCPNRLKVCFFLEEAGRFKQVVKPGIQMRNWHDNDLLSVNLGIPLEATMLPDAEYQEYLSDLLLKGARSLVPFAEKKKIDWDAPEFLRVIGETVAEYRAVDFSQVPLSQSELQTKWVIANPDQREALLAGLLVEDKETGFRRTDAP